MPRRKNIKVPAPLTEKAVRATARVTEAIENARLMLAQVKSGDAQALAEATLLQGILSGDVMTAAIAERQRLQRENLKLRQRLTHVRIRVERAKAALIEHEVERRQQPMLTPEALINELRAIYGLTPQPLRALPPTQDVVQPSAPQTTTPSAQPPPAIDAEIL